MTETRTVRALIDRPYQGRVIYSGDVHDVESLIADGWVQAGQAEYVAGGQVVETTLAAPVETRVASHSDQAIDSVNAFVEDGLTKAQAEALIASGYSDLDAAKAASNDELDEVEGIGPATVQKIRDA